jgi:hypothetical protein
LGDRNTFALNEKSMPGADFALAADPCNKVSPSEYSGIGGRVHKGLPIESKPPTTAPTAIQQIVDLLAA